MGNEQEAAERARAAAEKNLGPVKWCKRCSRNHPSRQACAQFLRSREIRDADGNVTGKRKVWAR